MDEDRVIGSTGDQAQEDVQAEVETVTADTQTAESQDVPTVPRNRGGAPTGNRNAIRHGLRSSTLPSGCEYLTYQLRSFRRAFAREVRLIHGTVSPVHEAVLQSAVRHETRCLLAARWLRIGGDALSTKERCMLLSHLSAGTQARDQALRSLGLDRAREADVIATLYSRPCDDSDIMTMETTDARNAHQIAPGSTIGTETTSESTSDAIARKPS